MEEKYNLGKTLQGKLTPSGIPYVKVKIKGIEINEPKYMRDGFESILDTGATKTHITPQFAKYLGLVPIGEDMGLYPLEKEPSVTSVYKFKFYINGIDKIFTEEFKELPYSFQYPIIFGTEFLLKCKELKMDFINKEYSLKL
jgi:hypothetical protein